MVKNGKSNSEQETNIKDEHMTLASNTAVYVPPITSNGSRQTCPHPLLQHFLYPPHSMSSLHSSKHIPSSPGVTIGHLPGFSEGEKGRRKKVLSIRKEEPLSNNNTTMENVQLKLPLLKYETILNQKLNKQ